MKGSANYQVNRIVHQSRIFAPGTSKHQAKEEAYLELKAAGIPQTSQNIASKINLHSLRYGKDCPNTWKAFTRHAFKAYGVRDVMKLNAGHISRYMEERISDPKLTYDSWRTYAAHLGKFEKALNDFAEAKGFGNRFEGFRESLNDLRSVAKGMMATSERVDGGFVESREVIAELRNEDHKLASEFQLESGARLHEAVDIHKDQLGGLGTDPHTGKKVGKVHLENTKGGKPRDVTVSPELYSRIEERLERKEKPFSIGLSSYRSGVSRAAERAGEPLKGTHNFRYVFAQQRYMELTREGMVHEVAIQEISFEMGHERADITLHYLGMN